MLRTFGVWFYCYIDITSLDSLQHRPPAILGHRKMPQKWEGALIWRVVVIKQLNMGKPPNRKMNFHKSGDRPILRKSPIDPVSRFCSAPVRGYELSRDAA